MRYLSSCRRALWSGVAVVVVLAGALAVSVPAAAQWVGYPTPHVPRKADGGVDMRAPAPRLANGKPDFSGIWISDRTKEGEQTISDASSLPSGKYMQNMGVEMPGGLPYQAWERFALWLVVGLLLYGFYGFKHSKLRQA